MARGVFRNLGIAGGGSGVKILKLYTDGVQNVTFDNSGTYPIANGYTADGASTFGDSTIAMPIPTSYSHSRILVTQDKINVTDYDYLNLAISYPNAFKHVKLDVKSIIGSYYVNFGPYRDGSGRIIFCAVLSNTKNKSYNDRVAVIDNPFDTSGTVTVSRVWLSKGDDTYLYKDGKQNVAWDNSGMYQYAFDYVPDGGAILNANNFVLNMPSQSNHNRTIVSDNGVDLTGYTKLKVAYTYNNVQQIKTTDITSIVGSMYISIVTVLSSQYIFDVVVSTAKNDPWGSRLVAGGVVTGNYPITVSRIWLEK